MIDHPVVDSIPEFGHPRRKSPIDFPHHTPRAVSGRNDDEWRNRPAHRTGRSPPGVAEGYGYSGRPLSPRRDPDHSTLSRGYSRPVSIDCCCCCCCYDHDLWRYYPLRSLVLRSKVHYRYHLHHHYSAPESKRGASPSMSSCYYYELC